MLNKGRVFPLKFCSIFKMHILIFSLAAYCGEDELGSHGTSPSIDSGKSIIFVQR